MPSVWSARLSRATGRNFYSQRVSCRVCTAWLKARAKTEMEVAINRRMKLRFPQGSEGNEQEQAQARASAMAVGLRLSSELVGGVLVGAALGWGFDRLLSTSPWGLIVFLLLGFIAGVINVMRAAGAMSKQSERL
jgi:F0F1-type ATP synthase assembly protein I